MPLPFKDGSLFGLVHESLFLELIGQEVQNRLAVVKVTVGVETVGLEKAGDFALNAVRHEIEPLFQLLQLLIVQKVMDGNDAVRLELRQGNGRQDHVDGIDLFLRQGIARHGADDDDAVLEISFEPRFYEQGRPHAAGADDEGPANDHVVFDVDAV